MPIGQKNIVDLHAKEQKDDDKKESSSRRTSSSRAKPQADGNLHTRLLSCFGRIADAAAARGDDELAALIAEDAQVMANGLVSLTRPFKALRAPLLLLLAVVEPVMAFSGLARLLIGRLMDRRATRAAQRAAEAGAEPEPTPVWTGVQ